jgi:exopolyphosphatase
MMLEVTQPSCSFYAADSVCLDLDSLASAIGLSWILDQQTQASPPKTIPLYQVGDEHDLLLRPENLYALKLAGIEKPSDHLLFLSDLNNLPSFPTSTFALVDHNVISTNFAPDVTKANVVAIVDHHKDGNQHKNANPRIINTAGSCASSITLYAREDPNIPSMPSELAALLLSAIFIDTNGLKADGKATKLDYEAAAQLLPQSGLLPESVNITYSLGDPNPAESLLPAKDVIKDLAKKLKDQKEDILHLSPRDLLRRDFKVEGYALSWVESHPVVKVGLATVPVRLKDWASKGVLLDAGVAWMKERGLVVLGILTSFKSKKSKIHKREMAWIVLQDEPNQYDHLPRRLWEGLEADTVIKVKEKKERKVDHLVGEKKLPENIKIKVYDQGNEKATRKVTAPLVEAILTAKASL